MWDILSDMVLPSILEVFPPHSIKPLILSGTRGILCFLTREIGIVFSRAPESTRVLKEVGGLIWKVNGITR